MDQGVAVLKYLLMTLMARGSLICSEEQFRQFKGEVRNANFGDDKDTKCAEAILAALEEYRK